MNAIFMRTFLYQVIILFSVSSAIYGAAKKTLVRKTNKTAQGEIDISKFPPQVIDLIIRYRHGEGPIAFSKGLFEFALMGDQAIPVIPMVINARGFDARRVGALVTLAEQYDRHHKSPQGPSAMVVARSVAPHMMCVHDKKKSTK